MSKTSSFAYVAAAAELLAKGIDISKLNRDSFVHHPIFMDKDSEFNIKVDEDVKDFFCLRGLNINRKGTICSSVADKEFTENLKLSLPQVKEIMEALYKSEIEYFPDFDEKEYIPDYEETINRLDKEFKNPVLDMHTKLTRDNTDTALRIFLALFDYQNNVSKLIYDDSKKDKNFYLTHKKDVEFEVIDNRLYIYLRPSDKNKIRKMLSKFNGHSEFLNKINAFVISKNVYDYFWASYGNTFQSCFALSSEYSYLYGYVPFAVADESVICYATTGGVNKIPIISGKQFLCPNMLFRCWGYITADQKLVLDKRYGLNSDEYEFFEALRTVISNKISMIKEDDSEKTVHLLNNGRGIYNIHAMTHGNFYSDSLRIQNEGTVVFRYSCGTNGTGSVYAPWKAKYKSFINYASSITSVSDSLSLDKPWKVVGGVLLNPKTCPVTGLFIDDKEDKSIYAKFYTKSCTESCVLTYIDGHVFCDASTRETTDSESLKISTNGKESNRRDFCCGKLFVYGYNTGTPDNYKCLTLKSLKEFLKGHIKSTPFDGILLRYFEGSEVRYQFFKGK